MTRKRRAFIKMRMSRLEAKLRAAQFRFSSGYSAGVKPDDDRKTIASCKQSLRRWRRILKEE